MAAAEEEKGRLKKKMSEGTPLDAAARVLVYIGKAQHRIEKSTFEALRKLLLQYPEVSPAEFKAAVRDQWAILAVGERAAIRYTLLRTLYRKTFTGQFAQPSLRRGVFWYDCT